MLSGYFSSVETFGNASTDTESVADVAIDAKGGVFTVGRFRGTVDFDPSSGVHSITSSSMDRDDAYIKRVHADGTLHWVRTLSSNVSLQINAIALSETNATPNFWDGELFVTGAFAGTVDFDPTAGSDIRWSQGSTDVFVTSLSDLGGYINSRTFGGTGQDEGTDVAYTQTGRISNNALYVSGYFRGIVDFDWTDGILTRASSGGADGFLLRYGIDGLFVQTIGDERVFNPFDPATDESIDAIGVADIDQVYVVGSFLGTVDFNLSGVPYTRDSGPERAAFIAKYRKDLHNPGIILEWVDVTQTTGGVREKLDITDGPTPAVTGVFDGTVTRLGQDSAGDGDIFVLRYRSNGTLLWGQTFGGSALESSPSIAFGPNESILVTGNFRSTVIDLAPGPSIQHRLRRGNVDAFVVSLGNNGVYLWGQTFGGTAEVFPSAITASATRFLVGGQFSGSTDFNPGFQRKQITSRGTFDGFLLELSSEMNITMPAGLPLAGSAYLGTADSVLLKLVTNRLQLIDVNRQVILEEGDYTQTTGVTIQGVDKENDTVTLDLRGGAIRLANFIRFVGGSGDDALHIEGAAAQNWTIFPEELFNKDGLSLRTGFDPIIYASEIESAEVRGLGSLEYSTGGSSDVLRLDSATASTGAAAIKISGTVDGLATVPLNVTNTANIKINAGRSDSALEHDRVTVGNNSLMAAGLQNLLIESGLGNDVLHLLTASLALRVPGGMFQYIAGEGRDSLLSTTDSPYVRLTDALLSYQQAGTLWLQSVETSKLIGGASANTFDAQTFSGSVTMSGGDGDDRLLGGLGGDYLSGGPDNDVIAGGAGNDRIFGDAGADQIRGGIGNDELRGGAGDDVINGEAGNDRLFGDANNDTLMGSLGDDIYFFGATLAAESDSIVEALNQGTDTLSFSSLSSDLTINLGITDAQPVHTNRILQLNSGGSLENVLGGSGNDLIIGNGLNNLLSGGNGNNILVGNEGADTLKSGSGRDILIGGLGLDNLDGGAGQDILIAGRTTNDRSESSLRAISAAWITTANYTTRVANLRVGVGTPPISLKAKTNVLNDAGEDDVLTGGTDFDWFFRSVDDVISDLATSEAVHLL